MASVVGGKSGIPTHRFHHDLLWSFTWTPCHFFVASVLPDKIFHGPTLALISRTFGSESCILLRYFRCGLLLHVSPCKYYFGTTIYTAHLSHLIVNSSLLYCIDWGHFVNIDFRTRQATRPDSQVRLLFEHISLRSCFCECSPLCIYFFPPISF